MDNGTTTPRSKNAEPLRPAHLPLGVKPSKAVSSEATRPILTSAYVRKADDGFELHATDSYQAVRMKIDGGEISEGPIPPEALKEIERHKERSFSAVNGRVEVDGGRVSYRRPEAADEFPDFDKLWAAESKQPLVFGLNTKILRRAAEAMGSDIVTIEIDLAAVKDGTYLRAFRVAPLDGDGRDKAKALVMPVRVMS